MSNREQDAVLEAVAQGLFDAPWEDWEDATQNSKDYYRSLARRALESTRAALVPHTASKPAPYWAGLQLADYLMGGEVSSAALEADSA